MYYEYGAEVSAAIHRVGMGNGRPVSVVKRVKKINCKNIGKTCRMTRGKLEKGAINDEVAFVEGYSKKEKAIRE
jgi:hypothetical protein